MYWNHLANLLKDTPEAGFAYGGLNKVPDDVIAGYENHWKIDPDKIKKFTDFKFSDADLENVCFHLPNYKEFANVSTQMFVKVKGDSIHLNQVYGCCGMINAYLCSYEPTKETLALLQMICRAMNYSVINYVVTEQQPSKLKALKKAGFVHLEAGDVTNKRTGNVLQQLVCHL